MYMYISCVHVHMSDVNRGRAIKAMESSQLDLV